MGAELRGDRGIFHGDERAALRLARNVRRGPPREHKPVGLFPYPDTTPTTVLDIQRQHRYVCGVRPIERSVPPPVAPTAHHSVPSPRGTRVEGPHPCPGGGLSRFPTKRTHHRPHSRRTLRRVRLSVRAPLEYASYVPPLHHAQVHGKLVEADRHDWGMHDEQQVGSRRTEARSVMERLNAAFDGARDLLEGLDAVEARVLNEPVPQVLLDTASRVQEASQQLQSGLRELVEYMIEDRGVSRKKVAEHLGLSPSTVARWMQERE